MTGLYPIGMYKLSLKMFHVGGVVLPYPDFLLPFHLPVLAGIFFGIFLVAWIVKTVAEFREGRGNVPKTLLLSITTVVSFCLPMGSNLDVLFQGYNTWHSFQYLFLLWLINRLRDQRGEIDNPFVQRMVRQRSMVLELILLPRRHRRHRAGHLARPGRHHPARRSELFHRRPQRPADALLLRSLSLQPSADGGVRGRRGRWELGDRRWNEVLAPQTVSRTAHS